MTKTDRGIRDNGLRWFICRTHASIHCQILDLDYLFLLRIKFGRRVNKTTVSVLIKGGGGVTTKKAQKHLESAHAVHNSQARTFPFPLATQSKSNLKIPKTKTTINGSKSVWQRVSSHYSSFSEH